MARPLYDIVMLVLNDLSYDGRVRREAAALAAAGWRVLVIGTQRFNGSLPDEETMQGFCVRRVRYGRYGDAKWYPWRWIRHGVQTWQIVRTLNAVEARAHHAHDLPALLVISAARALRFGRGKRPALVYDSHELFLFQPPYASRLRNRWDVTTRPLFLLIEKFLAQRTDAIITVCDTFARALELWLHVPRPIVVQNAMNPRWADTPAAVDLQALVGDGKRFIVHTGIVTDRGRCLTELVQAMSFLPDDVALVLMGPLDEADKLRRLAAHLHLEDRVFFVSPVPPEQVMATIRSAGAAAVLTRPDSWDFAATLPNKFFEAVAAGLPVVASNLFTLARIVRRYELGETCSQSDPQSIADAFGHVLAEENQARYRARVAEAQRYLNWDLEAAKLNDLYSRILNNIDNDKQK